MVYIQVLVTMVWVESKKNEISSVRLEINIGLTEK